jgi:subtilisin family serine protease
MKSFIFVLFSLCFLMSVLAEMKTVLNADSKTAIPNQYLVVFKTDITDEKVNTHMERLTKNIQTETSLGASEVQSSVLSNFHILTLRGFSAILSKQMLEEELMSDDVQYVEADQEVHALQSCSSQNNAVWGLDRIGERNINLDMIYHYTTGAGSGVVAYIIDTGIYVAHNEFIGRASWGANFVDTNNNDCNGHGTHVAGTVGGSTYGVAKNVLLVAVKVLNCQGSGSWTGVISGIDWVVQQYQSNKKPSVANMSLGGAKSTTVDKAVELAVQAGVVMVVAAGNSNADACNSSPSGAPSAFTVGATTIVEDSNAEEDQRAYFSNYGTCVAIFAPGQLIESAWIGSPNAVNTISGTSMASPHVCGAAAVYLSLTSNKTPADVRAFLTSDATSDIIDLACPTIGTCSSSPNKLLYTTC